MIMVLFFMSQAKVTQECQPFTNRVIRPLKLCIFTRLHIHISFVLFSGYKQIIVFIQFIFKLDINLIINSPLIQHIYVLNPLSAEKCFTSVLKVGVNFT